ncbi:MAG: Gfo/Idh/MocA family oxidoreductase [Opitutaceae bacterium]|nr:Gfo/Idh/MocA family oxidoreductase [Opitutaceae bacterium]
MTKSITLAQFGCGYWGPNLLRNFSAVQGGRVAWVIEQDASRRAFVERGFPGVRTSADISSALNDPSVDAVIVATPAETHFPLTEAALRAGKHVFVEKPLATRVCDVDVLAEIATEKGLMVMAGHTFLFNNAVRYVKAMIDRGELGEIRSIYSQRLNLGRIRSDIDALWNFAPHDLSIIQYWLGNPEPVCVQRFGADFIQPGIDDVVFLNVRYPGKILASIHVSWLDPQKVRKMVVVGSKKMVVYDDVAEDKITIYDKGIDRLARVGENMDFDGPARFNYGYRSGDILIPRIDWVEPLRAEAEHFLNCIRTGSQPLTGIDHARRVVGILELASCSQPTHDQTGKGLL